VKKGPKLLIEGFPTARAYADKDGQPKANLVIYANSIEFIGSKPKDDESQDGNYKLPDAPQSSNAPFEDIPF
jgi:single-stranded DNA-binding protein